MGEIWLEIFIFSLVFGNFFPTPQSGINSEKMCNLEALFFKAKSEIKVFLWSSPKFTTVLIDFYVKTAILMINF